MSLVLNICTFLIVAIFSIKTFALESSDSFETQILKMYNRNILVLNRGLEDAIFKKDHIKLSSNDGFIARGICVKATLLTSHWKIYRVVRPELVSKDSLYTLRSINQSEIPRDFIKYARVDFTKYFKNFGDEDVTKELDLQKERVAMFDLPNDIKQSNAFTEIKKTNFDKFIETTFSDKELKEDLSNFYLNFYASPLTWQTRYNQKETHYGAKLYNTGHRYLFEINSMESRRRILDPVTEKGYNSKYTHHDFSFQFNRLTENFSIISSVNYDSEKIGNIYYPYSYTQFAIIGLKYHVWEADPKDNFFEISYAPSFDKILFSNPQDLSGNFLKRQGIRHLIKVKIYSDLTERIHSKSELTYAPMETVSASDVDIKDTRIHYSQTFSYKMGTQFYWDYLLQFENDELRSEIYNISANNTTQTFRLRYEFDI